MLVQPYLFFDGRCDEAIALYRKVLGAEVTMLMRFRESPDPAPSGVLPVGSEDKVMHANLSFGDTQVMVSDGRCTGQPGFQGFALTVSLADVAEVERVFGALADGGQVQMPLERTFWSPRFGMLADRFGVSWMVMAAPEG
ncbi:VOC family protein [Aromatoleum toluclasticum]|uniref:VOC family protein n=1 Tax=Aromatoleum toluclasticum TaxID=92003 RepID=UPI001D187259|nr:VOC family protein [Aromatoleum toluclasticum]MCC4116908.1 VOC family protein [Aromatoleum toluclasticum]